MGFFKRLSNWYLHRQYPEGKILSRFIACDVARQILIVSAAKIEKGIITGRVRTINILYVENKLVPEPEFGPEQELNIDTMWRQQRWTGKSWGGLPDGTSILDHVKKENPKKDEPTGNENA